MKLFLPSARATNILLIVGFSALGYALYLRYLGIEQSAVGLACGAGLNTWLCFTRAVATTLFQNSVFGIAALVIAALNLLRPTLVLFAAALAIMQAQGKIAEANVKRKAPAFTPPVEAGDKCKHGYAPAFTCPYDGAECPTETPF